MADAAGSPCREVRPLTTRRLEAQFRSSTPRHWCPNNPFLTHVLNTYTVLVPGNEGFYIRTLRKALPQFTDTGLEQQTIGFIMQEGQHGVGHRRCWALLSEQGYRFRGFARGVDILAYGFVERVMPLRIRVSMVACIEHVNAYLGHEFLSQQILRDADADMRTLFEWHFAEEIEHKGVSFDVLKHVAPGYLTRLAGVLLTLPLFYLLMTVGALRFMAQDRSLWRATTWRLARRHLWGEHHMVARTLRHIGRYLRPRFHPWQDDDRKLAEQALRGAAAALTLLEGREKLEMAAAP
jgi:predicted metal-dependent hydrolase